MCRIKRLAHALACLALILSAAGSLAACVAPPIPTDVAAERGAAPLSPNSPRNGSGSAASLADQAAQEATAMIEAAQATAVMMKAQAQATALVAQAGQPAAQPEKPEAQEDAQATPTPPPGGAPSSKDEGYRVELVSVGFAADGMMIIVQFHATRKAVDDFWPGRLSVTDEGSGAVFNSVPVEPIIGPLIGRTQTFKQVGYVMFDNVAPGLKPGSSVTVQLGQFKQEHVTVSNHYQ